MAAEHLLCQGHRDIVFAGPSFRASVWCTSGSKASARPSPTPDDRLIATVTTTHASGHELGTPLRQDYPTATAVFGTADILAIGITAGLGEQGVAIPAEVSGVGFDDLDLSAIATPKLTTIAQDIPRKAALAVELLLNTTSSVTSPRSALACANTRSVTGW